MKKIFTLLMAMVVTLSMSAITPAELGKKDPTGHATKMVEKKMQHHKDVAKVLQLNKLERKAMPKIATETKQMPASVVKAQHAPQAQNEVINLQYDAFAGMVCYEEEGQWWIGLSCDDWSRDEYGHNLNLEWNAPADNPFGTFTTEDFEYDYTHLTTPFSYGSIHFSEITMTLSHEQVNANLERYTLTATLVGEDGNTYQVNAKHEEIIAKGLVEAYIEDATLTQADWNFTVEGKNADLDLKIVFNNSDVIGSYGLNMVDWENSAIAYKGASISPISFKATVNLATHTETGELAYVTEINMLGNDTVDYHVILAAPLPAPTDTIELTAIDLNIDDSYALWFGTIDFYATTPEFSIRGGWRAESVEEGTYDAAIFLDDADWNTITSLNAQIEVSLDNNSNWAIEATMLGNDNKVYNLHLSWSVPEQKDTVVVAFETSAKAKYYPVLEEGDNDLQLFNEDDNYSASINVISVEMGSEFDAEYMNTSFSYLEAKDETPISIAEIQNGKLYQKGDTTFLEVEYLTFEAILYQVKLWYAAPTPTQTVALNIENADCYIDFEYSGQYTIFGYSADEQYSFSVTVPAMSKEDIPGTFVNDGLFGQFGEGQYDFDASNSFVGIYNADWEMHDLYYIQKGQFTVELDEEDNITLTASIVCDDAIQYEVTLTSKYEEPHIEFDSESDPVERVYGADAELIINDFSADYGLVSMQIIDNIVGDITALYFVLSEVDNETIIPEGVYPIESSWWDYTVLASTGMDWDGSVYPSYYARYTDGWVAEPFYFFQEGTVAVTKNELGTLSFEINAANSCGIPVYILYDPSNMTDVENTNATIKDVRKHIINGQLIIVRDGKAFNAQGAVLKD